MKTLKAAKGERRAHRKAKDRGRGGLRIEASPMFGSMDAAMMRTIQAALESVDLDAPWPTIAPRILPVIKRFRQPFAGGLEPVYITVPPGIRTGFGVDVGPAFSHVTASMTERWGVSGATLLGTALDNLQQLVRREPPRVDHLRPDGVPVITVQGQGWGSSLILAPDLLRPILGTGPCVLMTPVRNTLMAIPESASLDFLESIYLAMTEDAPDALDTQILRWNGQTVVDLNDRSVGPPELAERAVELDGVVVQPAPPRPVIRLSPLARAPRTEARARTP